MSEIIWGWGAFVFGFVGMVSAVLTAVVALKAYKLAKQEFFNGDIGKTLRKKKLLEQLRAFKSTKIEDLDLTKVSKVVVQLLEVDPFTPNPFGEEDEAFSRSVEEYRLSHCYTVLQNVILKKQFNIEPKDE